MKKLLLLVLFLVIITLLLPAQEEPLSSSLFMQQDKKGDNYQCIQIRRGDIITLTGNIEFIEEETGSDQNNLLFTSLGGRTFLLKGEFLPEITEFYNTLLEYENITLTGKILFEGRVDMYAELEVSAYKRSE